MKLSDKQQELIDAYVKQELEGEALESFEQELSENKFLKEEVRFRQGIRSVFQVKSVEEVIEQAKSDPLLEEANERKIDHPQLGNVHDVIQQAKLENHVDKRRTIRRLVAVGIAASILLFIGIGNWWSLGEQSLPNLADGNFSAPAIELTYTAPEIESVSATQRVQALLSEALEAYRNKQFDKTLSIFNNLRSEYNYETDEMLLYEAIIDYQSENYKAATDILQSITTKNSKIKNEAHWYLALAYLKTEQKELAKKQLEVVAEQASVHQKNAKKLLGKIN